MAPNLRPEDAVEVLRAADLSAREALQQGFVESSICKTVLDGSTPIAMFGVVPGPPDPDWRYGHVWMLATPGLLAHAKTFMRASREWIATLSRGFDAVGNYVDARNHIHVKWLEHMGFAFVGADLEFGPYNSPFLEFVLIP
jgi:hypothetical protein